MSTHSFQTSQGIILQVIPFRDYDQIITLFTPDRGVLKVVFNGSRSKRQAVQGICLPLTLVECTYQEKNSELFKCQEMQLVDANHQLRQGLACLEAACEMLQIIRFSQLVGKPAPLLYQLLIYYLKHLPQAPDPVSLIASFKLKILLHDGLVYFPLKCAECQAPIFEACSLNVTAWYCFTHKQLGVVHWDLEEIALLYHFVSTKSYRELIAQVPTVSFNQKLEEFYRFSLGH